MTNAFNKKRDPVDVLHAALIASSGGIAGAARQIGRSPAVMHNKFSEAVPSNEVTAREAIALAHAIKTTSYAEAVCEQFDGVFMPLPIDAAGDDDILQDYLDIIQQMGDLSREFTEARSDGIIEPAEFASLKLRAYKTVAAIMHLLADVEHTVRELPASVATLRKA